MSDEMKSDGQTDPKVEYAPADMICPACRYVGSLSR